MCVYNALWVHMSISTHHLALLAFEFGFQHDLPDAAQKDRYSFAEHS